jgi:hypothetical protein
MVKDTKKVAKKVKRIKKKNTSSKVILNPKTKRYVKVTSKLGKEILAKQKVMKGGGGYNIKIDKMYMTCKTKDSAEDKPLYRAKDFISPNGTPEYRLFTDKEYPKTDNGTKITTIKEAKDSQDINMVVYVTSNPDKGVIFSIMKFASLDTSTGFDGSQNVVDKFDCQRTINVDENNFFVCKDHDVIGVKAGKIVEFEINNLLYVAASLDYHSVGADDAQPYDSRDDFTAFMITLFQDPNDLREKLAAQPFSSDDWYGNQEKLYKLLAVADFSSFKIPADHKFSLSLKFDTHVSASENTASTPTPERLAAPAIASPTALESDRPNTGAELLEFIRGQTPLSAEKSTSQPFHMPNDAKVYNVGKINIVRFGEIPKILGVSEPGGSSFIVMKMPDKQILITKDYKEQGNAYASDNIHALIYFTYVDGDGLGVELPYTYLEMHMVYGEYSSSGSNSKSTTLKLKSDAELIEKLQSEFRKQEYSLSNVFIIGKRKDTDSYLCIFYPVRLDVLLNKRNVTSDFTLALDFLNNYKK